jgi:putative endonuclease
MFLVYFPNGSHLLHILLKFLHNHVPRGGVKEDFMEQDFCERVAQKADGCTEIDLSTPCNVNAGLRRRSRVQNTGVVKSQVSKRHGTPVNTKHNKSFGRRGEDAACEYLKLSGYKIIDRNWRCSFGEADIIMQDGNSLVFVEVKTRRDTEKGFPAEAVGAKKREKYEKIALAYISNVDLVDVAVRFDVVSVLVREEKRALIKHHVNAFGVVQ